MSSKPAEARSIASQLVFLFAPAAALLLCCGLGVLYWIVIRHAYAEDRAVLGDKVLAVRTDLNSPGGLRILNQELRALQGGERAAYWVRVLDSAETIVAETPGMDRFLPVELFSPREISPLNELAPHRLSNRRETIFVSLSRDRGERPVLYDSGGAGSHRR